MKNKDLGKIGEDIACRFLVKRKFKIVGRNYLKKCGEIDVIAKKNEKIHFIEVKTVSRENFNIAPYNSSSSQDCYRPEDNIHQFKINRLKRVIQIYLVEKYVTCDWQFHAITVLYNQEKREARVEFLENLIL